MATKVTFAKTGNRLIALAHDPVARGILFETAKEHIELSSLQPMELDSLCACLRSTAAITSSECSFVLGSQMARSSLRGRRSATCVGGNGATHRRGGP